MKLHLDIVTPDRTIYSDDVSFVTIPTVTGELTILPNHIPLMTQLAAGEMKVKKDNSDLFLAITGGFLQVTKQGVAVLADYAIRSEEIELEKAQEAKKRAEKAMEEGLSEKDMALAQSELRKSLLELKVGERRKHRTHHLSQ